MRDHRLNITVFLLAWAILLASNGRALFAETVSTPVLSKKIASQMRSLRYETESQIKADLTPQFDKLFGYDSQWIQVSGQFDDARFLRDEGVVAEDGASRDLPGISIKTEGVALNLKSGPQIFKMYLTAVDITVYSRKEPSQEIQNAARLVLKKTFTSLGEPRVTIKFLLAPSLPIPDGEKTNINFDPLKESLTTLTGKISEVAQASKNLVDAGKQTDFIHKIFFLILVIELAILLVVYVLFSRKTNSSVNFDRLATSLDQIASAINERSYAAAPVAIQNQIPPTSLPPSSRNAALTENSSSSFSAGEEMIGRIQAMLDNDPELALLAGYQLLQSGSYEDAFILMGAINKDLRRNICDRVGAKVMGQFNEFVRSRGSVLMSHSDDFHRRIQTLYQKIWPASQDRDSFIYSSLSEMLVKLDEKGTKELFKLLVPNEISAYVSICGPAKFAALVLDNVVSLEECKDISSEPPSAKVIKSLFEKLTGIVRKASDDHEVIDPIFSVAEFLPQELEKRLLQSTGQSTENSFDALINTHFDQALEIISSYEVADIAALLATFDESTRDKTLSGLPEIKARRVKNTATDVHPRGLQLKATLQNALRQLAKEPAKEDYPDVA